MSADQPARPGREPGRRPGQGVTCRCDAEHADVMPPWDPPSHTATGSACGGGPYSTVAGTCVGRSRWAGGMFDPRLDVGPQVHPRRQLTDVSAEGQRVTDEGLRSSTRATGRAKGELARA